jgi:PAS domain S-box-containing protein
MKPGVPMKLIPHFLTALPPAHGMARTNYPIRVLSFAFCFLLVLLIALERPVSAATVTYAVIALFLYPHAAYISARASHDSRSAELNNLLADAALLGILAGQLGLPLWLTCGSLLAVTVNNAICGGPRRLTYATLLFIGAAAVWKILAGQPFNPSSGPLVTYLTLVGIVAYAAGVGLIVHRQNQWLVRTRNALRESEEQFRFIAENAGDLVAVLDTQGRFRYVSSSHSSRLDPGRLGQGASWIDLITPSERERARDFLAALLRLKSVQRSTFRLIAPGGRLLTVDCKGNPVHDGAGGEVRMVVLISQARSGVEPGSGNAPAGVPDAARQATGG